MFFCFVKLHVANSKLNMLFLCESCKLSLKRIDFLSIDVEGNELNVLKGFNLKKYKPTIILLEYRLPNLKEFYDKNIDQIIKSEIYQYMISNRYKLINWNHDDLMFMYED